MNYINLLSDKNFSKNRIGMPESKQWNVTCYYRHKRQIINFKAILIRFNSWSLRFKTVRYKYNFMPSFYKTLTKLITVHFNSSSFRNCKVWTKQYIIWFFRLNLFFYLIFLLNVIFKCHFFKYIISLFLYFALLFKF